MKLMRGAGTAAALGAALLVAGCSSSVSGLGAPAGSAGAAGPTSSAANSATPSGSASSSSAAAGGSGAETTAQLQAALLGINDVGGSGWSIDPSDSDSDDDGSGDDCGPDNLTDADHQAEVDLSQGTLGPFLVQIVGSATSSATAKTAYAKAIASFTTCSGQTQDDGSTETFAPMSFPKFGDQSVAYRVTEVDPSDSSDDSDDDTFTADIVVVQDGRLVEGYVYVDFTSGSSTTFETAVKNGVAKAHSLR